MTRCEYTVTYEDFAEAIRAYRRVSRSASISYWLYVWIVPAIGVALAFAFVPRIFQASGGELGFAYIVGCSGLGAAFGFPARYRIGIKRAYRQRNSLTQGKSVQCEFDDKTIRFIVPNGAEVSYPWSTFTNYFENEKVSVLFVKDAAFHTIPKSAMDAQGWDAFHTAMKSHTEGSSC